MMTIEKAKYFFKSLLQQGAENSEIKIYQKFLDVLIALENRALTASQKISIEEELTNLELNQTSKNRKKYLRKKLNMFLRYLKSSFSFVLKEHYANYGMSIGMVFGVAIGTAIFKESRGTGIGLCVGMFLGYCVGQHLDKEAVKQNLVLITTFHE
jgi:hypothetical protein